MPHPTDQAPTPAQAPRPRAPAILPKLDRVQVHGIPSVTSDGDHVVVGDGTSSLFFSPSSSPIIFLTCVIPI
jgi:hypothetical protein